MNPFKVDCTECETIEDVMKILRSLKKSGAEIESIHITKKLAKIWSANYRSVEIIPETELQPFFGGCILDGLKATWTEYKVAEDLKIVCGTIFRKVGDSQ